MATVTNSKTINLTKNPDPTQAELDAQIALGNYAAGTLLADIWLGGDENTPRTVTLDADENFVTDAQLVVIGNTSGTNTGDQDLSGLVPYTGATGNVSLGAHTIDAADFNGVALVTGGTATKYLSEDGTYTTPAGSGSGTVDSVVEGSNINVDATDPANPIVSLDSNPIVNSITTENYGISCKDGGGSQYLTVGSVETMTGNRSLSIDLDDTDRTLRLTGNATISGTSSGTNTGDQTSIVGITGTKAQFDTACSDGNFLYVGDVTQYTDELAQDAVNAMLIDTATIDFTYTDATPELKFDVIAVPVANEATDTTCFPLFATAATGNLAPKSNASLTFNSNTGALGATSITVGNTGITVGASAPFSDSAGTLTLQNVDALDATTEATIEAAIDTLANLTSVQGHTLTLAADFITSGANSLTLTTTGATNITLPTSGTLATLAGAESLSNKKLGSLTSNGFVITSGGDGTLSVDTTSYQPLDSDLTTIAGLTATTDNFLQAKSSAWASRTPTQVTADLINFVGDSGAGGTKGLVPAPATGDAAANKYLKANGSWATVTATATAAGSDTQVQFNDSSAFGGDSGLTYNKTSNTLTVENITLTGGISSVTPSGQIIFYGGALSGTIDNIYIGSSAPSTGAFTTLEANSLKVNGSSAPTNGMYLPAANNPTIASNSLRVMTFGAGASAVNYWNPVSTATGNGPYFLANGSDSNVDANFYSKGTGGINFAANTGSDFHLKMISTASAVNYLTMTNAATTVGPTLATAGTDSNISLNITPKGTGSVLIPAGNVVYGGNTASLPSTTISGALWSIDSGGQILGVRSAIGSTAAGSFEFFKSRGTNASPTIVSSGDTIGTLSWRGHITGTTYGQCASIVVATEGTVNSTNIPGTMSFRTAPSGVTPSEALKIDSTGAVYLPRISTTASAANAFINNASSPVNSILRSTSSLRYKTDVQELQQSEIDAVLKMRPVSFISTADADSGKDRFIGLIAEEMAEIAPHFVTWTKDEEGKQIPDGIEYDRIVSPLIALIQQQQKEIDALKKAVGI